MSTPAPRLTKKQQKALAHKKGVRKGKGKQAEDAAAGLLDVPEDDDLADDEEKRSKASKKRKRPQDVDDQDAEPAEEDEIGADGQPKKKKMTRNQQKRKANRERKQRFIVFVGECAQTSRWRKRPYIEARS